ncbi:MAG: tripartite tricarboxylate transporter TctB family protein [Candidatus Rokubacteria bacterium]|nr:tripartite tricarboxylate transporter TctB family protein [Candidatus Rokubacteria bacterium]
MRLSDGKVVGGILIVLGILALVEGRRIYALREQMVAGAVVGDDTFPILVGLALLLLGGAAAFTRLPSVKVTLPQRVERARMLWGAGLLAGYWLILPYLGYTGSTALVSTGLYKAMGGYRWPIATLLGGVTTGLLYLLFRVWLLQPLPTGALGF